MLFSISVLDVSVMPSELWRDNEHGYLHQDTWTSETPARIDAWIPGFEGSPVQKYELQLISSSA
jgi:hypothetical protein